MTICCEASPNVLLSNVKVLGPVRTVGPLANSARGESKYDWKDDKAVSNDVQKSVLLIAWSFTRLGNGLIGELSKAAWSLMRFVFNVGE
jgi:hypothetical protein